MIAPRYTNKVKKLIHQAHRSAEKREHKSIETMDLFLGASLVREGTLREMHDLVDPYREEVERVVRALPREAYTDIRKEPFSLPLSTQASRIWTDSIGIMKRYNQSYLNEGHIIKSFYANLPEDSKLKQALSPLPNESIIQSVTTARDLTVLLSNKDWVFKEDPNVYISTVQEYEKEGFLSWVKVQFGESWSRTIRNAFHSESDFIPVLKAEENGEWIGFAAYDVYLNKKGVFGPMGVLQLTRHKGVGKRLLYAALQSMKLRGYMYAILKEAGPIEFYERTVNAKLIPLENVNL